MKLLGAYKNGNFTTKIFSDGTKIRETEDDEFIPSYAENMDIKICNYCDMNCPYCHEGSTVNGKFGDILNQKFINTLHPYQEVAIGGGDPTSHPDLIPFLQKLKSMNVIANMTVNQVHFEKKQNLIKHLVDEGLIKGLGISLVNPTDEFISLVKQYDNAVIHVINGVLPLSYATKLSDNNIKMLVLGYKELRRGKEFKAIDNDNITTKMSWLKENIGNLIEHFNVVSFDNLAIKQLNIESLLSDKDWDEFYMGDDGTMTYYIDMVEKKFAKSSTADFNKRYDILDSVDDMFKIIVDKNKEE